MRGSRIIAAIFLLLAMFGVFTYTCHEADKRRTAAEEVSTAYVTPEGTLDVAPPAERSEPIDRPADDSVGFVAADGSSALVGTRSGSDAPAMKQAGKS